VASSRIGAGIIRTSRSGDWNTATDFYFECIYKNGVKLIVPDKVYGGVKFEGSEGWVAVNRGIDAEPKSLLESQIGPNKIHFYHSSNHHKNFIDCVLSRKEPIAPVETAHRSITIAHLGNIRLRVGRNLKWDPENERILEDEEANRMLSRPMRAPWNI
jgi:hypothetical protein